MKTVLITGTGRGLGRAIASAYHQAGFEIIATDIKLGLLSDIKDIERYTCIKLDVTSEIDVSNCTDYIDKKYGQLDVLISNAGIFDFYPVSEAGADQLKEIFDVNAFGLANLTKHFLPLLIKSKGRLIVIGSESYKVPSPFQPYAVSKQVLEKVYDAIRFELLVKGINTVLIRPGAMQTKILDDTIHFKNPDKKSIFNNEFGNFLASVPEYIRRISLPEQVASVVLKAGVMKKPKAIYQINHNPLITILSRLPRFLKERLIVNNLVNKTK